MITCKLLNKNWHIYNTKTYSMKKPIILLSSILLLSLTACKTKSKAQNSSDAKAASTTNSSSNSNASTGTVKPTSDPTVYEGVTDKSCAVEVSFGSPGSGIDGTALDKVNYLLNEKKVKYTSKNFGREGETRLCLPLTELKDNEKKDLITQLKKIAKEGQYVSVSIR